MKLPFLDHLCWLALRRVRRGRVARLDDRYVEDGLPLGVLLAELLDELRGQGLLTVTDPDPTDGLARVHLTDTGQVHYRTLCQRQQARLPAPSPTHHTTKAPTGHQPSTSLPGLPDR